MCLESHRGGQSSNIVELSWQTIRSVCVTVAHEAAPGESVQNVAQSCTDVKVD